MHFFAWIITISLFLSGIFATSQEAWQVRSESEAQCQERLNQNMGCGCWLYLHLRLRLIDTGRTRKQELEFCESSFGPIENLKSRCDKFVEGGEIQVDKAVEMINETLGDCTDFGGRSGVKMRCRLDRRGGKDLSCKCFLSLKNLVVEVGMKQRAEIIEECKKDFGGDVRKWKRGCRRYMNGENIDVKKAVMGINTTVRQCFDSERRVRMQ